MAKKYSARLKFQVVLEVMDGGKSVARVAREYGIHPNSIIRWRQELLDRGPQLFEGDQRARQDKQRIAQLERLLGQKEVEIALLRNFLGQGG